MSILNGMSQVSFSGTALGADATGLLAGITNGSAAAAIINAGRYEFTSIYDKGIYN